MNETPKNHEIEEVKRIMRELVNQPPKPHDQMKLGKPKGKKAASPKKRARKSQAK